MNVFSTLLLLLEQLKLEVFLLLLVKRVALGYPTEEHCLVTIVSTRYKQCCEVKTQIRTLSTYRSALSGVVGETTAVCSEVSDGDEPRRLCLVEDIFLFSCGGQYMSRVRFVSYVQIP
jgi:hypothetical protein